MKYQDPQNLVKRRRRKCAFKPAWHDSIDSLKMQALKSKKKKYKEITKNVQLNTDNHAKTEIQVNKVSFNKVEN